VRDAALARAYLRPEMIVADVGSGTGFVAMLEVACQNLAGCANVEYRLADGAALPFEAATLDAVFANMYLHYSLAVTARK
jgi:arsenite methyltransferase